MTLIIASPDTVRTHRIDDQYCRVPKGPLQILVKSDTAWTLVQNQSEFEIHAVSDVTTFVE